MFKNILIIGFGMIGSSIARTVLKKNKSIKSFLSHKEIDKIFELEYHF